MKTNRLRSRIVLIWLTGLLVSATAMGQRPTRPDAIMCEPGELVFSEDFDPATLSERWGFKADFALRDGGLLRTNVDPTATKRVFLRDAAYDNVVIQFDFKFSGETTDLRLVTGSGGGYNSVTQIRPDHFQINTPVDREAGFVPACLGECVRERRVDQWQTITIEYWGDEILAHLSANEFVVGEHPIVDRTRKYFAFQIDLPGASIDNVRVWEAIRQQDSWKALRTKLAAAQSSRTAVPRNAEERYKFEYVNLKSRLTLDDQAYRDLVAKHDALQAALHADYSEAFATHKQLSKLIARKKQHIKATDPEFKRMEIEVHRAARAEDAYVLSTKPQLERLREEGIPKQRYTSELGQVRARLASIGDERLGTLVAETARRQAELEARFPDAFASVEQAATKRKAIRKSLADDPAFQSRNRAVVVAGKAVKDYEKHAAPQLVTLEADSKAFAESRKSPNPE